VEHPYFLKRNRQTFSQSSTDLSSFAAQSAVRRMFASAAAPDLKSFDVARLQGEFEKLDPKNTGEVPAEDLRQLLISNSPELSSKDIDDIVEAVDEDNSGTISYTEFVAAAMGQQLSNQKDVLASVFKTFDIDEDGTVTRTEIMEMLQFQDVVQIADIDKILKEIKTETKDEVTFEEFCELVRLS
jgi:Ca2+-binding EF-hand superfamily protein